LKSLEVEAGPLIGARESGGAPKFLQQVRVELVHQMPSGAFSGYLDAVLDSIFMQFVLDNFFFWGRTLPVTAMTVSTQPGVHGITVVCVYSAAGAH